MCALSSQPCALPSAACPSRRALPLLAGTLPSTTYPSLRTLPLLASSLPSIACPMSQGSWTPCSSGSPVARGRRGSSEPWIGAATPLEVVPPPVVDDVTGLPLIMCPKCNLCRLTAFTCKWTRNRGKRFFMCPMKDVVINKCSIIMNQKQYEAHLQINGHLQLTTSVDVVPSMVMEEIEQVKFGVTEMKEELANIKLGIDEMKNKEKKKLSLHVIVFVVVMFVVTVVLKK